MEKYYQLGTHTEAEWNELNAELTSAGHINQSVPSREIECIDDQLHSPTRGTYLLTDAEADELRNDARIRFINIDYKSYDEFKPPPDELQAVRPELLSRYSAAVKNYREFETSDTLAASPNATDANRTGYQLYRCQQKLDPWVDGALADNAVVSTNISQYGTGKHVDVIVADEGCWIGHPEFQNNTVLVSDGTTPLQKPNGYTGGNVLPGNGTCDVLDVVLDGPYYLDPEWFDASPGTRLTTRWDGTIVPVETVARSWWSNAGQRSSKFANAGTVSISASYTRTNVSGNNTVRPSGGDGEHGTPCGALTYGRTQGWAYNANKWMLDLYGSYGSGIEEGFDIQKIFHQLKPINPLYGTKNPTISSNSWGYRADKDPEGSTYYYTHRSTSSLYTTETGINWLSHMGTQGDSGRWKSEMKTNSLTTAQDELIDAGVIFVVAAGNSNQKQVNSSHPDFNNYITQSGAGGTGLVLTGLTSSTTPTSGSNDDGYWTVALGFNISFNGTSYSTVYVGTNGYLTFGGGSAAYNSLSASNPAAPKIMIGARDSSIQRIYTGTTGTTPNRTYRIQVEGSVSSSGTLGSPTRVWEAVFYENTPTQIDIQIGPTFGTSPSAGLSGIYSASAQLTTTGSLSISPLTGNRIITAAGTATVTSIGSIFEALPGSLANSSFTEFGIEVFGTTNRRGFPQQGGKYTDSNSTVIYPVINIGALDDDFTSSVTIDGGFHTNLGSGANSDVFAFAIQPDGKILIGGAFTTLNGVTRNRLMRLNSDGTEDTAFYTNLGTAFNDTVESVAIQPDGKILIGGAFTTLNGVTRNSLVRLNSDGTENSAFYTNLGTAFTSTVVSVPSRIVESVAIQSDGKILVGGAFNRLNGVTRNSLVRLNSDGTEDTAFYTNLGTGFSNGIFSTNGIFAITIQSDGKILIGGAFQGLNGNTRQRLVRLNADGTEDTVFYNNIAPGMNAAVNTVAIQSDGKILVGGAFTTVGSSVRNRLVRLNSNGTEDTAFYTNLLPSGFNNIVESVAIQSDGKILVGGQFTQLTTSPVKDRNRLMRLNSDGTEDTAFYTVLGTAFNGTVESVAIQSDGSILIGGAFTTLNGVTRNRLARLGNSPQEVKVSYSDRGNSIDVYAPADGTLAANKSYTNEGPRPDTYSGFTYNSGIAYDCAFGGTSAACPVAAGFLATVMEFNRDWTWAEIKAWLQSLETQDSADFYFGTESTTVNTANWLDYNSLEGGAARVLYQGPFDARFRSGPRKLSSGLAIKGLRIRNR